MGNATWLRTFTNIAFVQMFARVAQFSPAAAGLYRGLPVCRGSTSAPSVQVRNLRHSRLEGCGSVALTDSDRSINGNRRANLDAFSEPNDIPIGHPNAS